MVRSPAVIRDESIWKALAAHPSIPWISEALKGVTATSLFSGLSAFSTSSPVSARLKYQTLKMYKIII